MATHYEKKFAKSSAKFRKIPFRSFKAENVALGDMSLKKTPGRKDAEERVNFGHHKYRNADGVYEEFMIDTTGLEVANGKFGFPRSFTDKKTGKRDTKLNMLLNIADAEYAPVIEEFKKLRIMAIAKYVLGENHSILFKKDYASVEAADEKIQSSSIVDPNDFNPAMSFKVRINPKIYKNDPPKKANYICPEFFATVETAKQYNWVPDIIKKLRNDEGFKMKPKEDQDKASSLDNLAAKLVANGKSTTIKVYPYTDEYDGTLDADPEKAHNLNMYRMIDQITNGPQIGDMDILASLVFTPVKLDGGKIYMSFDAECITYRNSLGESSGAKDDSDLMKSLLDDNAAAPAPVPITASVSKEVPPQILESSDDEGEIKPAPTGAATTDDEES